jgi:beta-lactamase superfamily II metal-dependent hydrolase
MIVLLLGTANLGTRTADAVACPCMTVHMVNVGGAGFIVKLPNDKIMVVDAGLQADIQTFYDELDSMGVTTIDYLVGTHGHVDHISSFNNIIGNYNVGKVVFPKNDPLLGGSQYYVDAVNAAANHGVPVVKLNAGADIFPETTVNGKTLKAHVNSPRSTSNFDSTRIPANSYSLVFNIQYGDKKILFTGDAMEETEAEVIANYALDNTQVLAAPHHGWNTSTTDAFFDYLESKGLSRVLIPNQADNTNSSITTYKSRLQARGLKYWSTYGNGTMYIRTDGTAWWASETAEWEP